MGRMSKSGIHRLLTSLEEQGRITRVFGRSRSIEIVPDFNWLHNASLDQLREELLRRGYTLVSK